MTDRDREKPAPLLVVEMTQTLPQGLTIEPEASATRDPFGEALVASGRMPAELKRIEQKPDGLGVSLTFSVTVPPRVEGDPPSAPGFDPWRATFEMAASFDGGIRSAEFADWVAAQAIEAHRAEIESDGVTLLSTMDMIAGRGLIAPRWLAAAFAKRWHRFNAYEARTLDEVFDHRPIDPRTMRAARRSAGMVNAVHLALCDAVRADPSQPIHAGFPFEQVAAQFGIGKTLCYELYRKAVDVDGLQDISELRKLLNRAAKKGRGSGELPKSAGLKRRR